MSRTIDREVFEQQDHFGIGAPNDAFAQYFIGNSYLKPLTEFGKCPVFLANVTFEPGCRNNWHIHHATSGGGQLLICTAGEGWYQEEGKEAVSLTPGTVITIPANVSVTYRLFLTKKFLLMFIPFRPLVNSTLIIQHLVVLLW